MKQPLFTKADFTVGAQPAPAAKGADAAFTAWRDGTSLKALVTEYGGSRSAMRKRLTQAAGGKDAFRALRTQGAGGVAVPFGGKRATGGRTREQRVSDDAGVKRISSTKRSKGWREERRYKGIIVTLESVGDVKWREEVAHIFVSPKGRRYVQAKGHQAADLIFDPKIEGLAPYRLIAYDEGKTAKRARADEAVIERGHAALERTRASKRAKRAARKAREHK